MVRKKKEPAINLSALPNIGVSINRARNGVKDMETAKITARTVGNQVLTVDIVALALLSIEKLLIASPALSEDNTESMV
jgi:hypothetical protein